jgi:hypothetical protein
MRCTRSYVANFVVKDSFEQSRTAFVAQGTDALHRRRGHVEPARFEHQGHDRQTSRDVMRRGFRRLP